MSTNEKRCYVIGDVAIPQWLVLILLSSIGIIIWWGIRRLVETSDTNAESLIEITRQLSIMNGRLNLSELVLKEHITSDKELFKDIKTMYRDIEYRLDK